MEPGEDLVAILGASPKPERFANRALRLLRKEGFRVVPINPAFDDIEGEPCYRSIAEAPSGLHTITVYLRASRSTPLIDQIIAAAPRRIVMNPGAENSELARRAEAAGIEIVEDCTLVMLNTGTF